MNQRTLKASSSNHKPFSRKVLSLLRQSEDCKIAGEHVEAIKLLEKVLADDPECLEAAEEIANNFLSLDEEEKARQAALYALSLDEKSYTANHVLGFLALHKSAWDEAIKFLTVANHANHNNPEILRCLGWGLFHKGRRAEGVATLERALNLQPESPMALCDLGICLLQNKKLKEARVLLEKAFKIEPDNERVVECLSLIENLGKISG